MAAYPSGQCELSTRSTSEHVTPLRLTPVRATGDPVKRRRAGSAERVAQMDSFFDQLIDQLADQVAAVVIERLAADEPESVDWLDCRHAAEYLGVHRDTLRKLAAERAIPSEQDSPGCKLYFRRGDLDAWRRGGGRPRHLAATLATAA